MTIFQRNGTSHQWDKVARIDYPRPEGPVGNFSSFNWADEDGAFFAAGAPNQEKPRRPDEERKSGAAYLFQETHCSQGWCSFQLVGKVPCRGQNCGRLLYASNDSRTVLVSFTIVNNSRFEGVITGFQWEEVLPESIE